MPQQENGQAATISIHALLAESDHTGVSTIFRALYFYPRSPCGERPHIHSTSPGRRGISIHALLAESDPAKRMEPSSTCTFLSTLSLRRATCIRCVHLNLSGFLSTLSLRRATERQSLLDPIPAISIHALLAESDAKFVSMMNLFPNFYPRSPCGERQSCHCCRVQGHGFLSTLSLRRATL